MYVLLFILFLVLIGLALLYDNYRKYNEYINPEGDVYINFV